MVESNLIAKLYLFKIYNDQENIGTWPFTQEGFAFSFYCCFRLVRQGYQASRQEIRLGLRSGRHRRRLRWSGNRFRSRKARPEDNRNRLRRVIPSKDQMGLGRNLRKRRLHPKKAHAPIFPPRREHHKLKRIRLAAPKRAQRPVEQRSVAQVFQLGPITD